MGSAIHDILTPGGAEVMIFWENKANTVVADALATSITMSSAVIILTVYR